MAPRIPLPRQLVSRPFTVAQGRAAGLTVKRMRGTDLQRPFSGVRVPVASVLNAIALATALQGRLPADAYFSGITAAVVMGLPLPSALESSTSLHVSVPSPQTPPRRRGVIGHSVVTRSTDIRSWNGLRISTPPRTWCDLASALTMPDLVAVGDHLISISHPLATIEELRAEVAKNPNRRGRRKLIAALELLDGRSESRRESLLRVILVTARLGDPTSNLPIRTTDGYNYRGDIVFRAERVIVEYQSDYHRNPEQFRKDMTRISRLQADGWFVIQVNADDLSNPAELVARIRRVLVTRAVRAK